MILYHFTSPYHLPAIFQDGHLQTVESNVSFKRQNAGPDVVWVTTRATPGGTNLYDGLTPDKQRIRFTLDIPKRDVNVWREWAKRQGSHPNTMRGLSAAGGSGTWRVIQRPVTAAEWVSVENLSTATPIVTSAEIENGGLSHHPVTLSARMSIPPHVVGR